MNNLSREISCIINQRNKDLLLKVDALYVDAMLNCGLNQRASKRPGDFAAVKATSFRKIGENLLLQRKNLITQIRKHMLGHLLDLVLLPSPTFLVIRDLVLADLRKLETAANTSLYLASLEAGFDMKDLLDPALRPQAHQFNELDEFILLIELPAVYSGPAMPATKKNKVWEFFIEAMQYVAIPFIPHMNIPFKEETTHTEAAHQEQTPTQKARATDEAKK